MFEANSFVFKLFQTQRDKLWTDQIYPQQNKTKSHLIAWSYNLMSQILEILEQVFHTSSIQCYQPVSLIIYLFLIISDTKSQ